MRILYVEDNPANISLLQRVARMGGHEVLYYNEGEKALENFASDNPDLILMDLQLAGKMGGLDVVRKLRSDGVSKPIVAVTAYAMMGDKERCLEAGCDAYLSKPLPVAELVEMVSMYQEKVNAAAAAATASAPTPEKPAVTTAPEKTTDAPAAEAKPEAVVEAQPAQPEAPAKAAEPEPAAAAVVKPDATMPAEPAKAAETSAPPKPAAAVEPVAVPAMPVPNQNGHTTSVG